MTLHYEDSGLRLFHGSNKDVLGADALGYPFEFGYHPDRLIADASFDSIVTDPPYELGFMGKGWDSTGIAYDVDMWRECFRVLKPGGYLLSFGGTRTWHRVAVAIEDAGFEVRDSIAWLYGSGFPKSLDVSKAIDKAAGAERVPGELVRDRVSHLRNERYASGPAGFSTTRGTTLAAASGEPVTGDAQTWSGWGTALKPAFEPIVVARKPFRGTVASNVLRYGTGAINIDATRVPMSDPDRDASRIPMRAASPAKAGTPAPRSGEYFAPASGGRFPSNVLLSHSPLVDPSTGEILGDACAEGCVVGCAVAELDSQAPNTGGAGRASGPSLREPTAAGVAFGARRGLDGEPAFYGDKGGASRFFPTFRYEAKAPGSERPEVDGVAHATVKPLDLMRWLVRLVTRRGGHVLDPFAGSGTTGEAALLEGMDSTLIEFEEAHLPLILARVRKPLQPSMFGDWEEAS